MEHPLHIYNSLTRRREQFVPLAEPHVGLYVCGPTVYGDAHLGHARPAITFDILFRFLRHLGYKVRYVRNITDVGHLEHDADSGEDKIAKKARLEQLEPMEVVQYYLTRYHEAMAQLGVLPPSIELSGRRIEDMLSNTRSLDGQDEKRNPLDFALWKKAQPEHIMRWPSPWGEGFPGWHAECTAMGRKYLGEHFDIHGGGMDLVFPHHECEIAQAKASQGGHELVRYWMHNNMITIEGQKMGKSLGNFITLEQFFTGDHPKLAQAYSPMTIRFFIRSAHYRGTVDFSNEALQAAQKGLSRLLDAAALIDGLKASATSTVDITGLAQRCHEALCDDLNTPMVIAELFDAARVINAVHNHQATITAAEIEELSSTYRLYLTELLGLVDERQGDGAAHEAFSGAVDLLLSLRQDAKSRKDWTTSDRIRDELTALGFTIKDTKEGTEWSL